MSSPLFAVGKPRAGIRGGTFILQGPVSSTVDVMRITNRHISRVVEDSEIDIFIPSSRFFSNRGLRWYAEVPTLPGENTFNISAGILQKFTGTEFLKPDNQVLLAKVDYTLYPNVGDMGDAGDWTTDETYELIGFESTDDVWDVEPYPNTITSYIRNDFTIPDTIKIVAARLKLEFNESIEVYLDGSSVYKSAAMPASGWAYGDLPTASVSSTSVTQAISPSLLDGDHVLAIAHKRSGTENIKVSATLELDIQRVQWTEPEQVVINIAETEVEVGQNFNHLDEWGLVLGVERFPGERNAPYKKRLQRYVNSDFGITVNGIVNGASARLGIPDIDTAIEVSLNTDTFQGIDSPITNDLVVTVVDGKLSLASTAFNVSIEPDVNEDYMMIEASGDVYDVSKVFGLSQGDIDPYMWELEDNNIFLYGDIDPFGYQVDYSIWHRFDLFDKTVLDVATWINGITASGVDASGNLQAISPFLAEVSRDAKFLSYSGQILSAVNGSNLVVASGELDEFDGERGLFFNIVGNEDYYGVSSINGSGVYLDRAYQGVTASGGDFEFNKTIDALFIPSMSLSPAAQFDLPVHQIQYRPFHQQDWDAFNSIDNPRTEEAVANVKQVEGSIRNTWEEVIVDYDVWDVFEAQAAGGATIPNIYDGPKTLYRSAAGRTWYTPSEARALNYVDPLAYDTVDATILEVNASNVKIQVPNGTIRGTGYLQKLDANGDITTPRHSVSSITLEEDAGLFESTWYAYLGLDNYTDVVVGDSWQLQIVDDNELQAALLRPEHFQSGVDLALDALAVQSVEEVTPSGSLTPSGHVMFSQIWEHPDASALSKKIGTYFDKPFYRDTPDDITTASGDIAVLGPSGQFSFYVSTDYASGQVLFADKTYQEDYKHKIVGIPFDTQAQEYLDIVFDRSDTDWQKEAFRKLMINSSWQSGSIVIGDYNGKTNDLLLFVNHLDEDVISDGPTFVLRIKDVI